MTELGLPIDPSKLPDLSELLLELYRDLAAPGVRQVGKALETVMQLGNSALLPFRLLNKVAAEFERVKFEEIASRFAKIPIENVVEVRPEIAAPILDALSVTADAGLRSLFIELLAKAADRDQASLAHPSFTKIIEQLAPDEAVLIQCWCQIDALPYVSVSKQGKGQSSIQVHPIIFAPKCELIAPQMSPTYLAHLAGIGILEYTTMSWLTSYKLYEEVICEAKKKYPSIKEQSLGFSTDFSLDGGLTSEREIEEGDFFFEKGVIKLTPYGRTFIKACVEQPDAEVVY